MSGALKARIAGRQNCEACLVMLIENEPPEYAQGVANACEDFAAAIRKLQGKEQPTALLTMTPEQATAFENERITFGKHAGERYGDIPREYLEWLADSAIRLQAYLRSKQ